ncbi:ribbon-helix-helix protein, CopG family [Nocardia uniformis]|uniref:Ribbon-helix-helix protein, CopG family n=1 Tax=Nocardia uniformis TaxID=53432 RepID=A0A849CCV1_9NOCA|nr:ribbon-helix-helix protein, CopG family [Nocardia uniformis]NNH74260.1 ribbon-helix-helix protein, CopG family [Nocardia uniformis]
MAWTLRLSDDDEAALGAQSALEGRSKQEITRDAVRTYLERHRTWDDLTFDRAMV